MKGRRQERVNEMLRRHVSSVMLGEVKDPRVGFVTVIKAQINDDGREAQIYVTLMDDDEHRRKVCLSTLNEMRGFFQKGLSKVLGTRVTPVLRFCFDEMVHQSYNMDVLIARARQSDMDHQGVTEHSEDTEHSGDTEHSEETEHRGENPTAEDEEIT